MSPSGSPAPRAAQRDAAFAVCCLCRVCRHGGAPAPDVGKQRRARTGAVHLSQSSRLAQLSSTHVSEFPRAVALAH